WRLYSPRNCEECQRPLPLDS
ncbi:hypothetical protein AFLA70_789g000231, partial [Aspergillus flavus AF70]